MITCDRKKLLCVIFAFLGLSILTQFPIWMVQFPPLIDYPNHLARMHIISHIDESPILQKYYSVDWHIVPNLAMDIIVPVLAKFMPTDIAGKVFIGLIFFMFSGGSIILHYAIYRKISCLPLLAFMFLYNRIFLWGFLNYLFGLASVYWVLAGWIYLENKPALIKASVFIIPTLCIFFSHLYALGVYALSIIGYEFYRYRNDRMKRPLTEWAAAFAQFFLPIILFFRFSPTSSGNTLFGEFSEKIVSLIFPLFNYNKHLDIATFFILSALFLLGVFSRKIYIAKQMLYPILLLCIAGLAMPETVFSSNMADKRIHIAIVFLLVSVSELRIENHNLKFKTIPATLLLIVFLIRMAIIANQWQEAHTRYVQYVKAIDNIEEGSRLLSAVSYQRTWDWFPIPITNIPCISVITKSAFSNLLFTFQSQQPLAFRKPYREIAEKTPGPVSIFNKNYDWETIMANYDYLLISNEQWMAYKVPAKYPEIYRGTDFRLLKLRKSEPKT